MALKTQLSSLIWKATPHLWEKGRGLTYKTRIGPSPWCGPQFSSSMDLPPCTPTMYLHISDCLLESNSCLGQLAACTECFPKWHCCDIFQRRFLRATARVIQIVDNTFHIIQSAKQTIPPQVVQCTTWTPVYKNPETFAVQTIRLYDSQ